MADTIKYLDLEGLKYYDGKIKSHIATKDAEIKVVNADDDKTLIITAGGTTSGTTTNTKVKVNIDKTTIVTNAKGELSVASDALVLYIGDGKAITISDVVDGEKTVSLKVKSGDLILASDSDGLSATLKVKALTASEISALSDGANVKEAYKIVGIGDTDITNSDVIKVYKDKALLSVKLLHANGNTKPTYVDGTWTDISTATEANLALCFAYQTASGTVEVEAVPVGDFLRESEFGKGLAWNSTSGKVEGVVDSTSESFLTVGEDGFKLSGVLDAIDEAAAKAKTTLTEVAADGTIPATGAPKIVVTKTTASDGHSNYTVSALDMASKTLLDAEITRAKASEAEVAGLVGLTGDEGSRVYSTTGTFIGKATAIADITALDSALAAFTPITYGDATKEIDSLFA